MQDFGFYLVITNPVLGYERCCEEAVKAKVKIVQLRMKDAPREEIVAVAKAMRRITRGTDTLFIVNDDPSIAAEVEADGVHVGQSDMRPTEIRRLYPMIKIIGLSTHNLDQVHAAVAEHPDYIGVGPVFATPTKKIPDPVLGPEMPWQSVASTPTRCRRFSPRVPAIMRSFEPSAGPKTRFPPFSGFGTSRTPESRREAG